MHPGTKNLQTYKILFLIKGILTLVFSLFFVMYAVIGLAVSSEWERISEPSAPVDPGSLFIAIGIIGMIFTASIGTITIIASKFIGERRKRTFIIVASAINCLTGILGILLCIFTILELSKPEVKEAFGEGENSGEVID